MQINHCENAVAGNSSWLVHSRRLKS